jgi:hypothetical protein
MDYYLIGIAFLAIALNGCRVNAQYNVMGLTTFIGVKDYYFSERKIKDNRNQEYNGIRIWSLFYIPVNAMPFRHSTGVFD